MNQEKTYFYFHFTLGPVQGFVAQARRTRDFWAGSFILSWLSAVAMRAVIAQGGKIVFPKADEHYLKWLVGKGETEAPRQGSVPNRFKAEFEHDLNTQNAEQVVNCVQKAWTELAEIVWENDLKRYAGEAQRAIWDRQIQQFWEITWVITDDETKSNLLDRRKNCRNHFAPDEPGVKCMMMAGWQELSAISAPNKVELDKFWAPIRQQLKRDLADDEFLCAIAFVKRRFVHHFQRLSVQMPGGWQLTGWPLISNVPSASYMAAVRWLEKVIENEEKSTLDGLLEAAKWARVERGEWHTDIACIKRARKKYQVKKALIALDGHAFFPSALNNTTHYNPEWAKAMLTALKHLENVKEPPSPFYAILLMDGDSLGSKMGEIENQAKISSALQTFTDQVPNSVYENNGFLVYAGGDDVLAILPLEDALPCAVELRQCYQEAFKAFPGSEIEHSTISGAIEFVHINMPLTKILKDAHNLLDKIAKEKCGRDAIAVRVWKPGGKAIEWTMKWDEALDKQNNQFVLETLSQQFKDESGNEATFSSKFFYKIRQHFELFNDEPKNEPKILTKEDECALLAADYLASGVNDSRIKEKQLNLPKAKAEIQPLLEQCRQFNQLKPDGAFLVRFLANKGIERK
jgi:CRISPR-associated protein Cmr2